MLLVLLVLLMLLTFLIFLKSFDTFDAYDALCHSRIYNSVAVFLFLNIHASCCPQVLAGGHNIQLPSEPHRVEVTSYNSWAHPDWNPSTLDNDIALVELPAPLGSVHKVLKSVSED